MSVVLAFQTPPGKPILRGNAHYWRVILDLDRSGPWSIHDVDMRSRVKARGTITDYVKRLVAAGIAVATGETVVHRNLPTPTYRLTKRPLVAPNLTADGRQANTGRGQAQMWNVIRGPVGAEGFTAVDVHLYASTDEVAVSLETAQAYLRHLDRAGYLLCLRKGRGGQHAVFRLKPAMNTGPKPPMLLRTKIVFDRNKNAVMGPVEAEEASS